jgi:hypothetical protein
VLETRLILLQHIEQLVAPRVGGEGEREEHGVWVILVAQRDGIHLVGLERAGLRQEAVRDEPWRHRQGVVDTVEVAGQTGAPIWRLLAQVEPHIERTTNGIAEDVDTLQ